jgi:hypothetical protein
MTEPGANTPRTVSSLAELPQAIEPQRDLWPQIEARIAPRPSLVSGARSDARRTRGAPLRWLAAAAMVSCVAVGVWIGRSVVPHTAPAPTANAAGPSLELTQAAFVSDPRYQRQHEALLRSLQTQLATLPAPTRAKVMASLATIRHAQQDLQDALGRDPGNALLQELLVNTYQDEMRVLTDVREASDAGRGI